MSIKTVWENRPKSAKKEVESFLRNISKTEVKVINSKATQLNDKVFKQFSCLDCGNCCKSISPILNATDVQRLAKKLGMSSSVFQQTYIRIDEDGDMVMQITPCPFLMSDNTCMVYESRPKACRDYPHLDGLEFVKNKHLHVHNMVYCPVVYVVLEELRLDKNK